MKFKMHDPEYIDNAINYKLDYKVMTIKEKNDKKEQNKI